ncbi:MAG: class I SAM-dependent methyltransferase [Bryobacteraceae bacterium]|jgi:SAM-dependent methyltransferase
MGLDPVLNPTQRFSSRAEAYARFRPSYPRETLGLLERQCGLTAACKIADIGSGTGLLARLFLDFGCEVTGVEPNPEMRAAGERMLSGEPLFHSVDGRAEATTLPDRSMDFVTAGQAFHWFEPAAARAEFQRILQPPVWVVLIWNERLATPGFMAEYEALMDKFAREKAHPTEAETSAFYGHANWRLARIPNRQPLNLEGLRGRIESSSWSPLPGADGYEAMIEEMTRLFRKYERDGRVTIEYETTVYYGSVALRTQDPLPEA